MSWREAEVSTPRPLLLSFLICLHHPHISEKGRAMPNTEIFVDKFYTPNLTTEDIFPSGVHLKDMMVVLINDPEHRVLTTGWLSETDYDRAKERNRWCRILDIKVSGDSLSFVGAYEDGTMRIRHHLITCTWLVKKNSVDVPYKVGMRFDDDGPDWMNTLIDSLAL